MKVQLLFFEGCAFWQTALEHLKTAMLLEGIPPKVELVRIGDDADATSQHFLGSPSVRLDGNELWPEERGTYALTCRLYQTAEGLRPWPSVSMLRQKVRAALDGDGLWALEMRARAAQGAREGRLVNRARSTRGRAGHQ